MWLPSSRATTRWPIHGPYRYRSAFAPASCPSCSSSGKTIVVGENAWPTPISPSAPAATFGLGSWSGCEARPGSRWTSAMTTATMPRTRSATTRKSPATSSRSHPRGTGSTAIAPGRSSTSVRSRSSSSALVVETPTPPFTGRRSFMEPDHWRAAGGLELKRNGSALEVGARGQGQRLLELSLETMAGGHFRLTGKVRRGDGDPLAPERPGGGGGGMRTAERPRALHHRLSNVHAAGAASAITRSSALRAAAGSRCQLACIESRRSRCLLRPKANTGAWARAPARIRSLRV
jgi:hypothetical protein